MVVDVPVIRVTFALLPPRRVRPAGINNLTTVLYAFAACDSPPPAECYIAHEGGGGGGGGGVGRAGGAGNTSALVFRISFPSITPSDGAELDASGRPLVTIAPAALIAAAAVAARLRSTPVEAVGSGALLDSLGIRTLPSVALTTGGSAAYTFPPSPPPATPPPASPPGLCSTACDEGGGGTVGVCNDGGSGDPAPALRICPLGSDCADCGSRDFCLDCPPACIARNERLPANRLDEACTQVEFDNTQCDPGCNVRECAYDGGMCTVAQIRATCMDVQERGRVDYSTPPIGRGLTMAAAAGGGAASRPRSGTDGYIWRSPAELQREAAEAREAGLVPVALTLALEPLRTILLTE